MAWRLDPQRYPSGDVSMAQDAIAGLADPAAEMEIASAAASALVRTHWLGIVRVAWRLREAGGRMTGEQFETAWRDARDP
jgi:hypothetical protein